MPTNTNQTEPLARAWEKAYERIKNKILRLEFGPGEVISELKLARELGISRTPVREAIRRLEHEGLIETRNKRKRIYILRIHEIDTIFDLKRGIEGEIARVAPDRRRPEHSERFGEILESIDEFAATHSFTNLTHDHTVIREWLELDRRFHSLIFEMAGNKRADQIVENLNHQWHRLELGILAMEGRLEQNIEEHKAIGQAILADDGERARDLLLDHLDRLHATITNIMQIFHFPS